MTQRRLLREGELEGLAAVCRWEKRCDCGANKRNEIANISNINNNNLGSNNNTEASVLRLFGADATSHRWGSSTSGSESVAKDVVSRSIWENVAGSSNRNTCKSFVVSPSLLFSPLYTLPTVSSLRLFVISLFGAILLLPSFD